MHEPAAGHGLSPADRRTHARRRPLAGESLSRVRLRTGREMNVVDISRGGALLEGVLRLLPNTHLDIHVVPRTGRVLVRCRVVRAFVCEVLADLVRYRAALEFERNLDTDAGYAMPATAAGDVAASGTTYPQGDGHRAAV